MVPSLMQLCVKALGQLLCWGSCETQVEQIPEIELVLDVWRAWQANLAAAIAGAGTQPRPPLPLLARQQQVLEDFATAFWRPLLLRLAYPAALPPGLGRLHLVTQQLLHLELAAPALQQLDTVAAACPNLRCLSLRGCTGLGDASFAQLANRLTALQALDLGGLAALSDGTAYHVAKLASLSALNASGTFLGDRGLESLVYGLKLRAWQRAQGSTALPPEAVAWPALPLEHLQLAGTHVTAAGVAELAHLPCLRFLDVRSTGIQRPALGPLQRRFALQFVQAAVLSSSNTVAAAVVNQDAVLCRCGHGTGNSQNRKVGLVAAAEWEAAGVQLLLHFDPAVGLAGLLELNGRQRPSPVGGADTIPTAAAAGLQHVSISQGRSSGYRQPRQAAPASPELSARWQQRGAKRKLGMP